MTFEGLASANAVVLPTTTQKQTSSALCVRWTLDVNPLELF